MPGLQCAYCGKAWKENNDCCASCGAPNKQSKINYYEPFFDSGYIVYTIRRYEYDCVEWIFYKGITFIGKIRKERRELERLSPAIDIFPNILAELEAQL